MGRFVRNFQKEETFFKVNFIVDVFQSQTTKTSKTFFKVNVIVNTDSILNSTSVKQY